MAKIQFGWMTPTLGIAETHYVPLVAAQQGNILSLVAEHFDSLWVHDHLYAFGNRSDPWLECWTTITWLAASFPTIRVGPIVLAVGFRNPALLAKMAASLQVLSAGRFIMGIGAGWREEEYRAYGYAFPRAAMRIKQLEEAVHIIRRMWLEDAPTFKGEYFQIEQACCEPRPLPLPPIMIGGEGEKSMLPLVARLADLWDVYHWETFDTVDIASYRLKRDLVHRHAETAGRNPAEIAQSLTIGKARLPQSTEDSEHWLRHLRPLVELGIEQFILDCGYVTSPEPITRFAAEVISPLRGER